MSSISMSHSPRTPKNLQRLRCLPDSPAWPSRPFTRRCPHSQLQQKCLARTNVCCIVTTDTGRRVES
ncbi:hypothetical protein HZ326_10279 [Fusarium oxysporum f. sp. albedinis]|nr:hypothetical protein HZ326_10279 [Fusarium oxysporum f. sp. albedinis]